MIDAYLNIEYAGNTWFDGLEISRIRPDDPLRNSLPVAYLDMSGLGGCYGGFVEGFSRRMSEACGRHGYLLSSDRVDDVTKDDIDEALRRGCSPIGLTQSLHILTGALRQHHGMGVAVLIDPQLCGDSDN